MRNMLLQMMRQFEIDRTNAFAGNSVAKIFTQDFPAMLISKYHLSQSQYSIVGSVGKGNWAQIPWICIFDRDITTSATKGVYICYLFSADCQSVFLTLIQGMTDLRAQVGGRNTVESLHDNAQKIIDVIDTTGFISSPQIHLGNNLTTRAKLYENSVIIYKQYTRASLETSDEIEDDLSRMLKIYKEYKRRFCQPLIDEWWPPLSEYDPGISKEQWFALLNNPDIIGPVWGGFLAAFYLKKDGASCKEIGELYHRSPSSIIGNCTNLGKKIHQETNCSLGVRDNGQNRYWTIMFLGRDATDDESGSYIWKLRPELYDALTEFDIMRYEWDRTERKAGRFDSWEIIDENTAIKHCDKSFFEHNGSGVPKEISWFFDASGVEKGSSQPAIFKWNGEEYNGRIQKDSSEAQRIRVFWNTELGRLFAQYSTTKDAALRFVKQDDCYILSMMGGGPEMTLTSKEIVAKINAYIASKGFTYEGKLIENFYLSLKSKPFVILAGTSGTGKTRLVKLFAEAIGAAYKLVPVRPDWSDSTDLFGHVDLNGRFVPGAVIDFIKAAQDDPGRPYFLCLDEMNLARVEYYLSDFLSVIETRDMENGKIVSDPLVAATQYGPDKDAIGKYGTIIFPQNLYVVGTVNMDETTFPFSKKVLDRANTIEFSYVDLIPKAGTGDVCEVQPAPNSFLQSDYLLLSQCIGEDEYIGGICAELQKINIILQSANAHVGYRVRDEIVFYMVNNKNAESLMTDDEALDHEILQKILPRIQGSSASVKDMLCKLFDVFAADHNQRSGDSDSEKMQKVLADASVNCKYRRSAEKLLMMVRRFEEDGFTSYWL